MDAKLQQAVDASRAGNKVEAQKILVKLLQENPDEVQGWYLLSLLVDDKEQQAAYAAKALALDPNHEKAQERLSQLQTEPAAAAAAVTPAAPDLITQEQGDTLPDWMAGDEELVTATAVAATAPPAASPEEELPDWIQEPVSDSWMQAEETAPAAKTPAAKTKPAQKTAAKPKKKKQKKGINTLDLILALLVIAVLIVVIFLFYLVTTS